MSTTTQSQQSSNATCGDDGNGITVMNTTCTNGGIATTSTTTCVCSANPMILSENELKEDLAGASSCANSERDDSNLGGGKEGKYKNIRNIDDDYLDDRHESSSVLNDARAFYNQLPSVKLSIPIGDAILMDSRVMHCGGKYFLLFLFLFMVFFVYVIHFRLFVCLFVCLFLLILMFVAHSLGANTSSRSRMLFHFSFVSTEILPSQNPSIQFPSSTIGVTSMELDPFGFSYHELEFREKNFLGDFLHFDLEAQ
jgi:hypothetical protein